MKRVLSACETKPETIEGTVDYSELSENILTNQIKVDMSTIQRYAERIAKAIQSTPEAGSYDLFLGLKEYVEEVEDCYDALHRKMQKSKSRKRA